MNEWKPQVGDKVRVLTSEDDFGDEILVTEAHYVFDVEVPKVWIQQRGAKKYGTSAAGGWLVSTHQIEPWDAAEQAQDAIGVGAIVDVVFSDGTVRGVVYEKGAGGVMVRSAKGTYHAGVPNQTKLIFPPNHPVAKSLALRNFVPNGADVEYRTGDVVELNGEHHLAYRTVTLGKTERTSFETIKGEVTAFMFEDDGEEYGVYPPMHIARLVTPRELRADLTEDEWQAWFGEGEGDEQAEEAVNIIPLAEMSDTAREQTMEVRQEFAGIEPQTFAQRVHSEFTAKLDAQTAKGIATYGMTLDQNREWDCLDGALDEIVDAFQYVKSAMERRSEQARVIGDVVAKLDAIPPKDTTPTIAGVREQLRELLQRRTA